MARSDYGTPLEAADDRLIHELFGLGGIGYVALGKGQEVRMREAPGMVSRTTAESNFYEELIVNPTLLKLIGQRGGLDCGGVGYVAIGYGDFMQVIIPMADGGHASLGVSRKTQPGPFVERVREVLQRHAA